MGIPAGPTTFDPDAEDLPGVLHATRLPDAGAGRVVALVSSDRSGNDAWARRSAVSVARAWARGGVRVFLADLSLADPHLHETLGLENTEGVADMFRFGSSLQRVARRIDDLPFFFTSAGSPTYEPADILASDQWDQLADGFKDAGAALLLYLPASVPGASDVLRRASDVLILGDEAPELLAEAEGPPVLAWVSCSGGEAGSDAVDEASILPAPDFVDVEEAEGTEPAEVQGSEAEAAGWAVLDDWSESETQEWDIEVVSGAAPESPAEEVPWGTEDVELTVEDVDLTVEDVELTVEPVEEPALPGDPVSEIVPVPDVYGDEPAAAGAMDAPWAEEPEPAAEPAHGSVSQEWDAPVPAAEQPAQARDEAAWSRPPRDPSPRRDAAKQAPPKRSRRALVWGGLAAVLALAGYQLWDSGLLGDGAGGAGGEPPAGQEGEDGSAGTTTAPDAANEPVVDPGPPTSPLLGASLVLQSSPDPAQAQALADRLSQDLGDLLFIVVPSTVDQATWYRTMAGPARDLSEIPGIQERIETAAPPALAGTSGWFPRQTELAFLLEEVPTIEEADRSAARYRTQGIPAYVLAIDYSAGPRRFRVYAGGYAFENESRALANILQDAGLTPSLVQRLGSLPRGPA